MPPQPLIKACRNGLASEVRSLFPLMAASNQGHVEVVDMLLAAEANVNAADKTGSTALFLASGAGHPEIVEHLCASGADINAVNNDGFTSLMAASKGGHKEVAQCLKNLLCNEVERRR